MGTLQCSLQQCSTFWGESASSARYFYRAACSATSRAWPRCNTVLHRLTLQKCAHRSYLAEERQRALLVHAMKQKPGMIIMMGAVPCTSGLLSSHRVSAAVLLTTRHETMRAARQRLS